MLLKQNDWLYQKLISHKLKLVYLRIPKCASSSMVEYIKSFDPDAEYKRTKRHYRGYFHFTVVRDNMERVKSTFKEKIWRANKEEAMGFIKQHPGLVYKMPYKDFLIYASSHDDPHWIPCEMFYLKNCVDIKIYNMSDVVKWPNFPENNKSDDITLWRGDFDNMPLLEQRWM